MSRPKFDLRLPTAAISVWSASLAVWLAGATAIMTILALALLAACALPILGRLGYLRHSPVVLGVALVYVLLAVGAATAVTGLAKGGRAVPDEVLASSARVTLTVNSTSKQLASPEEWQTDRYRVHASLTNAGTWQLDTPAIVFGGDGWQGLPIGSVVTASAKVSLSEGAGTVVLITAHARPTVVAEPGWIQGTMNIFREALRAALAGRDPDSRSLVAGLAIGDESQQTPELGEAMQRSGLSHLTAVSGGNTAIVLLLVLGVVRLRPTPIWVQAVVAGCALAGYLVLVGPQPSVLRATGMGVVALVGFTRGGLVAGIPVLSTAIFALILLDPALSVSIGFALSVAATSGLLLVAPLIKKWIQLLPQSSRLPPILVAAIAITTAAQIATAPLLLAAGNEISIAALPANLLVAPTIAPITIAGLLAAVIGDFFPFAATVIAWPAALMGSWVAHVAFWTSSWDWATLSTLRAGILQPRVLALVISVVAGWLWFRRRKPTLRAPTPRGLTATNRTAPVWRRARTTVIVVGALGVVLMLLTRTGPRAPWQVIACDVGQGSATLLQANGHTILVDAGPEDGNVAGCLRSAGVQQISAVVITHLHKDHYGGLVEVLQTVNVAEIYTTSAHQAPIVLGKLTQAKGRKDPPSLLSSGDTLRAPGLTGQVIWPPSESSPATTGLNNGSLVIRFVWDNGLTLLTTGDVEALAQDAIVDSFAKPGRVDVVTIPHHGSNDQDDGFPAWVSPEVAIASVGEDNEYGHPTQESLSAYRQVGAIVFRTDESRTLKLRREADTVLVTPID